MMRFGLDQRLTLVHLQTGAIHGKTLDIATRHFELSEQARHQSRRKFWFFAQWRSKRAGQEARRLDGIAIAHWRELMLRYRPLVSNCFKSSGLAEDSGGGYASAMPNLARQFEVVAQRQGSPRCFAEILWLAVCDCVPGGKPSIAHYRERFHLLALLDEFDHPHQGTIRTGYFYQDGSAWTSSSADPNIDLKLQTLLEALAAYADFLASLGAELDRLTFGAISTAQFRDADAAEVLIAWLL